MVRRLQQDDLPAPGAKAYGPDPNSGDRKTCWCTWFLRVFFPIQTDRFEIFILAPVEELRRRGGVAFSFGKVNLSESVPIAAPIP